MNKYSNISYCKNCGKQGHSTNSCKVPITSYGVIAFRYNPHIGENEYLMVCRKNSFGFIDFMRGKYSIHNKLYIMNMVKQMTNEEKHDLKTLTFDELWIKVWNLPSGSTEVVPSTINEQVPTAEELKNKDYICYKNEEYTSKDKFNILKMGVYVPNSAGSLPKSMSNNTTEMYGGYSEPKNSVGNDIWNRNKPITSTNGDMYFQLNFQEKRPNVHLSHSYYISQRNCNPFSNVYSGKECIRNNYYSINSIIDECMDETQWGEPEWGFPKGRRNYQEKDYVTAIREFSEETGYENKYLKNIQNIMPFEEILIGSNYKSYKNKYYLMYINYNDTLRENSFETNEISKIEWKTYEQCLHSIRYYNLEKKRLIINIHHCLNNYNLFM